MSNASIAPTSLLAAVERPGGLILARDAARVGLKRELRTELERGRMVRLHWGVYMPTPVWSALSANARYLARIRAFAAVSEEPPIFSHYSAAAIWGLPLVGQWPEQVHIAIPPAAGGRSGTGVVRHAETGDLESVVRDGLRVTPAAPTAVAMARILPFAQAVAMTDKSIQIPRFGTALATRGALQAALASVSESRRAAGRAAAQRAVEFATTLSGSAGESISRANMFMLGFLLPELQVRFDDADGFIGYTDFFWRSVNRIGEFDGFGKYRREEFARARTVDQIMIDEKVREDRLRACGPSVSRWGWDRAVNLPDFGAFLARIGIPRVR